jgi:hypothetical protein
MIEPALTIITTGSGWHDIPTATRPKHNQRDKTSFQTHFMSTVPEADECRVAFRNALDLIQFGASCCSHGRDDGSLFALFVERSEQYIGRRCTLAAIGVVRRENFALLVGSTGYFGTALVCRSFAAIVHASVSFMDRLGRWFQGCFVSVFFHRFLEPIQFSMVSLFYCATTTLWCAREIGFSLPGRSVREEYSWDDNHTFVLLTLAQMCLNIFLVTVLGLIFLGTSRCCRPDETRIRRFPTCRPQILGANLSLALTVLVYFVLLAVDAGVIVESHADYFSLHLALDATGYLFQILYWGTSVKDALWGKGGEHFPGSFKSYKVCA